MESMKFNLAIALRCFVIISLAFSSLHCSDNGKVILNVKTTGCLHNCIVLDKSRKCPSVINVNGMQMSHQKDGFNIAVIDNYSENIKTGYFRWSSVKNNYRNLLPSTENEFPDFIRNITTSSTVVVVLQNMCSHFDKKWYRYLQNAGIKIQLPKGSYDIAILVGCKISCPKVVGGSLPFSYYGNDEEFTKTITFSKAEVDGGDSKDSKETGQLGSILGGVIAFVFVICIAVILYISNKRTSEGETEWNEFLVCWKKAKQLGNRNNVKTANEEPLIEEPRYETMHSYNDKSPHNSYNDKSPHNSYNDKSPHNSYKDKSSSKSSHVTEGKPNKSPYQDEPIYEVIQPNLLNGETNQSSSADVSRNAENEYYQTAWTRRPSNIQGITSICSLVADKFIGERNELQHPAVQAPGITSVCSLVADALIGEKNGKLRTSSKKHKKHQHSSIERNKSCRDQMSNNDLERLKETCDL